MKRWAMRALGVLNILFVFAGLYYSAALHAMRWGKWSPRPSELDWAIFAVLCIISLVILIRLGYTGIRLLHGDSSVLRSLTILFTAEILYLLATSIVDWTLLPAALAHRAVGFWEGGLDLLTPQYVTGYPVIGAIAALLLSRSGDVAKAHRAAVSAQSSHDFKISSGG